MGREHVDTDNLKITGADPSKGPARPVSRESDVVIVINQAYGPDGESLIGISDATFDGFPAITLWVRADGREGLVHLSPIHGDRRKSGFVDIPAGTKCELMSPVTKKSLDHIGKVVKDGEADYYAIYLTEKLDRGSTIYVSDLWGHYHSRVVHNNELISYWAAAEDGVDA